MTIIIIIIVIEQGMVEIEGDKTKQHLSLSSRTDFRQQSYIGHPRISCHFSFILIPYALQCHYSFHAKVYFFKLVNQSCYRLHTMYTAFVNAIILKLTLKFTLSSVHVGTCCHRRERRTFRNMELPFDSVSFISRVRKAKILKLL